MGGAVKRLLSAVTVAATLTGFIAVSAPQARSATKRPDLVEASLSKPPPARLPGDSFAITDKVKNAGTARAGKSTTRYYLSLDQRKGASDILLGASRSVRALNPGQSSSGKANIQIPVTAPLAVYFVLACADDLKKVRESSEGNNCRASPSRISVTQDSIQKILDELSAGHIDANTALEYEVFAGFGDARLPAQYRGYDANLDDDSLTLQAAGGFGGLTAEQQAAVLPYLIPPAYAGSWTDTPPGHIVAGPAADPCTTEAQPKQGWHSTELPSGGTVKVWWPDGLANGASFASTILTELEGTIVPKETQLMGRSPLTDAALRCNGGDGNLDVYLLPSITRSVQARGFTVPPTTWDNCSATPAYIELSVGAAGPARLPSVAAHEYMHAVQLAYGHTGHCLSEWQWLMEAMGKWAEDYVYPIANYEQQEAPTYLYATAPTLSDHGTSPYAYPDYLFLQYLARGLDSSLIPSIWLNTGTQSPYDAIDSALGNVGGLQDQWPKFAQAAWNRAPVDHFKQWDNLSLGAQAVDPEGNLAPTIKVALHGAKQAEIPLSLYEKGSAVYGLGSIYYDFKVTEGAVRLLEFQNPFNGVDPKASVQALVRMSDGTWLPPQDWTSISSKKFCRDKPEENVSEVVEIFSNSSTDESHLLDAGASPELKVKSDCQQWPQHWSGSISGTIDYTDGAVTKHADWSGNVSFVYSSSSSAGAAYDLEAGTVTVNGSVEDPIVPCSGTGTETLNLVGGSIDIDIFDSPNSYHAEAHATDDSIDVDCTDPDQNVTVDAVTFITPFDTMAYLPYSAGQSTLSGTSNYDNGDLHWTGHWSLNAA
jgi:hypothetical protein